MYQKRDRSFSAKEWNGCVTNALFEAN